jgi:hypothetical protein
VPAGQLASPVLPLDENILKSRSLTVAPYPIRQATPDTSPTLWVLFQRRYIVLTRVAWTGSQPSSNAFSPSIDRDCEALRSRVDPSSIGIHNFRNKDKARCLIEAIEAQLLIIQDFKVRHDLAALNKKQGQWVTYFLGAVSRLRVITGFQ